MVKAKRSESLLTASNTISLLVNINASSLWNNMIKSQKIRPITVDVVTETIVANLAPFPLPAPNSFATLTLNHTTTQSHKHYMKICTNEKMKVC